MNLPASSTTPPPTALASQPDVASCAHRAMFEHITSKWGVLVLSALDGQTLRWSELRRAIDGVTEKMLNQTLRTLEGDGLILRTALPVVPPHVEYSLTDDGVEVVRLLSPLLNWIYLRGVRD